MWGRPELPVGLSRNEQKLRPVAEKGQESSYPGLRHARAGVASPGVQLRNFSRTPWRRPRVREPQKMLTDAYQESA